MEPRYSLSAYAVVVVVSILGLELRGFDIAGAAFGGGLVLFALGLDLTYVRVRRPERLFEPRGRLDRVVRRQLASIVASTTIITSVFVATDAAPLNHAPSLVKALIIGLPIAIGAIYASSLVDWYWILPKVSGLAGPAPCEEPGQERWAGLTNLWLFHRSAATTIVTAVIAGVPGYLAGTSHNGAAGTAYALVGSALAIGYNSVTSGIKQAFFYAFNTTVQVGDVITVRADPADAELQPAYVVDVSVQGLKYKTLRRESNELPLFLKKGFQMPFEEVKALTPNRRVENPGVLCPGPDQCQAINWYCHRNPLANCKRDPDYHKGHPLGPRDGPKAPADG